MEPGELLSIAEFALKAGITKQAVYRQLNNRLKPFVQLVDTRKMLEIRALQEIYGVEVEQPIQPELNNQLNNPVNPEVLFLRGQVELLQAELAKEREHNREQAEQITQLAAKAQRLAEQAHGISLAQLTKGKPLVTLMGSAAPKPGILTRLFGERKGNQ